METDNGMKRCDCARGQALAAASKPLTPREPAITSQYAMVCAEMMSQMDFFPPIGPGRGAVADEIAAIAADDGQAIWLATRMNRLFVKWPGVLEMRRVFCATYQPIDGLPGIGESQAYPDGFPSEHPPEPDPPKYLLRAPTAGEISAAPSVELTIRDLARAKDLNRVGLRPGRVHEIPIKRPDNPNPITWEDVRRAEEELLTEKAEQELAE